MMETTKTALSERLTGVGVVHELAEIIAENAKILRLPQGSVAFHPGDEAGNWLIVLSGRVRVSLMAETGREIILYRVAPGESCVLTTSCLLSGKMQSAEAVTETATELALIPAPTFRELLRGSDAFRNNVLAAYAARIADLVLVLEDTVFHALPERLARALLQRAEAGIVHATHSDLAAELGTAREVVTRALNAFSREGLVALSRGEILLVDAKRLTALARA
jgi:CRP/FNR family transcriptional regulator, anaerobic regulatory protein